MHPVFRYFTFRESTEGPAEVIQDNCVKSECNFQGCNFTIKGKKLANLMIHLSLKHRDTKEFAEFLSLNNKFEAQRRKSMDNSSDRIVSLSASICYFRYIGNEFHLHLPVGKFDSDILKFTSQFFNYVCPVFLFYSKHGRGPLRKLLGTPMGTPIKITLLAAKNNGSTWASGLQCHHLRWW